MIRKIVVVKKRTELDRAWKSRSFSKAKRILTENLKPEGFSFDETFHPIPVRRQGMVLESTPPAAGFNYANFNKSPTPELFTIRANFENEEAAQNLLKENPDQIHGIFPDLVISTVSHTYCGNDPVGDWETVAGKLGTNSLNLTGKGVRVAIVDTGINAKTNIGDRGKISVAGGWGPPDVDYKPGSAEINHGTMCAFDVRISAPDAKILDYALLRSKKGSTWNGFLSDAIAAFADLIDLLEREPGPLLVNNSWGLFDRSNEEPIGSPGNYSANPNHPFNQIVGSLVAAGADVFFAAGNCGANCPDGRCGGGDKGPGKSIHGANSHPDVITVAAITTDNRRLGYSSQGPGGLYQRKPDIAAYSHFKGSGVYSADGGTSAASPVAVGAAAALREKFANSVLSPAALKGTIQRTAIDINNNGWDYDTGYGVINPIAVLNALRDLEVTTTLARKKRRS